MLRTTFRSVNYLKGHLSGKLSKTEEKFYSRKREKSTRQGFFANVYGTEQFFLDK